jgi:hypothetical protein
MALRFFFLHFSISFDRSSKSSRTLLFLRMEMMVGMSASLI